jgi:hypothetical protein
MVLFLVFIFLLYSGVTLAVTWSPQGNISLKDRYFIMNDPIGNCSTGEFVEGKYPNGTWICSVAAIGDITGINTTDDYLIGGCTTGICNLSFNETTLNITINSSFVWRYVLKSGDNMTGDYNISGNLTAESLFANYWCNSTNCYIFDDLVGGGTDQNNSAQWNTNRSVVINITVEETIKLRNSTGSGINMYIDENGTMIWDMI